MAKKRREAAAEEEEEQAPREETPQSPKKKKKQKKAQVEEEAPAEVEEVEEAPKKTKKKKQSAAAADVAEEEGEAEVDTPTKKVKRRKAAGDSAAGAEAEADEAPAKADKKKRRRSEQEDAVEEAEAEEEPPAKAKKKGKAEEGENTEGGSMTVFVGGIPWSCTQETLTKDFGECGEVVDVNMLFHADSGLPRGIAFITFATNAGVQAALKYDGDDYGGRTLKVNRAETREGKGAGGGKAQGKGGKGASGGKEFEVFIKNLSSHTEEAELRTHFEDCGEIAELSFPLRTSNKCKGFAWISFTDKTSMDKAIALHDSELKKFKIVVEKAGQHLSSGDSKGKGKGKAKGKGKGKGKPGSEFEVFVNNLTYEVTEKELRKFFTECGTIDRMHMPVKGEKNQCMGFAWITFKSQDAVTKAIDRAGEEYEGRRLKVEKSGQHRNEDAPGDAPASSA